MLSRLVVHSVKLTAGMLFSYTIIDPARLVLTAAILRRARARHPHLFDGDLALKAVEEALKELDPLRD